MSPKKRAADLGLPFYFDVQAKLGHTKHLGGAGATEKIAEMCHISEGTNVLYVGCGAGASALYLVEHYNCRLTGVDLLESMVESSRALAKKKGLGERVRFQVADAQELPFPDEQFDVLLCESINTFVPDLDKAAQEYLRVVKPGGYVGLSEAIWVKPPPPSAVETMLNLTGEHIRTSDVWEAMLRDAGVTDLQAHTYELSLGEEARNQFAYFNWKGYLRLLSRFVMLFFRDQETRTMMKYAFSNPKQYFDLMGYGLYVGRKPG